MTNASPDKCSLGHSDRHPQTGPRTMSLPNANSEKCPLPPFDVGLTWTTFKGDSEIL